MGGIPNIVIRPQTFYLSKYVIDAYFRLGSVNVKELKPPIRGSLRGGNLNI